VSAVFHIMRRQKKIKDVQIQGTVIDPLTIWTRCNNPCGKSTIRVMVGIVTGLRTGGYSSGIDSLITADIQPTTVAFKEESERVYVVRRMMILT